MEALQGFLTTTPMIAAVLIAVVVYTVIISLMPKHMFFEATRYTRNQIKRLAQDGDSAQQAVVGENIYRNQAKPGGVFANAFYMLPLAKTAQPRIQGAGLGDATDRLFIIGMVVFVLALFALKSQGWIGLLLAVFIGYAAVWFYIGKKLSGRSKEFLSQFPDAIDMIVRSVRSGFPLNAAVNMVAETMASPIKEEFKQVSDEVAYGSTLVDALGRLGDRLNAADVNFFVVVLTLQQDVGGNLAEVLENLSGLLRKRKTLRMKIQAMTAEGNATMWVLSALPVFVFSIMMYVSPEHLDPFFTLQSGQILLGVAIALIVAAIAIIKKMINLEV